MFSMNNKNGREVCSSFPTGSAANEEVFNPQAPTKNTEIKDDLQIHKHSESIDSKSQIYDNIQDKNGKKTACHCLRPPQLKYSLQLKKEYEQPEEQHNEKPKLLDCLVQGCQKDSCFEKIDKSPMRYPSAGKTCVPEHVRPHPPINLSRRPVLPDPPEMLSNLKQGIRNPFQITSRKKEMETYLDKLTDEHQAFAFPPGTKPFIDNVYHSMDAVSSLIENFDLIREDIHMQQFSQCAIRPLLLGFNTEKYKLFREQLPMPQKRILNIPGNRITHWHNWVIRPLHTRYSESWREDIKVPDNWFGPLPPKIC